MGVSGVSPLGKGELREVNNFSLVKMIETWESFKISVNLVWGYLGSKGRYAPPALRIAKMAINISKERSKYNPTNTSDVTPQFCK